MFFSKRLGKMKWAGVMACWNASKSFKNLLQLSSHTNLSQSLKITKIEFENSLRQNWKMYFRFQDVFFAIAFSYLKNYACNVVGTRLFSLFSNTVYALLLFPPTFTSLHFDAGNGISRKRQCDGYFCSKALLTITKTVY